MQETNVFLHSVFFYLDTTIELALKEVSSGGNLQQLPTTNKIQSNSDKMQFGRF